MESQMCVSTLCLLFLHYGFVWTQNLTNSETHDHIIKELRLCNTTFNWTIFTEPVLLRLPVIAISSYGRPLHCQYTFLGRSHHRISLRVMGLHAGTYVESTKRCKDGYLKIWDGSRGTGRHMFPPSSFCGHYGDINVINVQRISTGPNSDMDFYVSGVTSVASFRVEVTYINYVNATEVNSYPKQLNHSMKAVDNIASVCYWNIQLDDCQHDCPILSPGYPGIYPPNTECYYHVTSHDSHVILQLKAMGSSWKPREFNLQKNCRTDYVEIFDGKTKASDRKIGRFCGQNFPNITTTSNDVIISFFTGSSTPPYNYTGFHLSAIGVTKEWHKDATQLSSTLCSWQFNATAGSISSPEHWLPRDTTCHYGFHLRKGYFLELILHVYGLDRNCLDYIEIREGNNQLSKLCDEYVKETHETFIYNLTSSNVSVRYFTTSGQMEGDPGRGFWLSYRQIRDPNYTSSITQRNENAQPVVDYELSRGHQRTSTLWTIFIIVLPVPCIIYIT